MITNFYFVENFKFSSVQQQMCLNLPSNLLFGTGNSDQENNRDFDSQRWSKKTQYLNAIFLLFPGCAAICHL